MGRTPLLDLHPLTLSVSPHASFQTTRLSNRISPTQTPKPSQTFLTSISTMASG